METRKALVFFDIDGTLLDHQQQVPTSAVQAIARLRANGHLAFINTGRCMAMVSDDIQSIGFDGIIASCGTHITVGEQTLENILIPEEQLRSIIDLLIENRIDFWLEGPDHVYLDPFTHPAFYHKFLAEYPGWPGLFADFRTASPLRVNKFSYLINRNSRFDRVEPILRNQFDLIVHHEDHGEVIPRGFSKATGMEQVKTFLGLTEARIFAFGDSLNDLDMLKAADVGIAMGGSRSRLIELSSHLTDSPAEHGIANALRHYQLIE
jgi:hypothetical protein